MREKPLVLIVDDEKNFREIISVKLKASGFDVVLAKNDKEGLKMTGELLPDLVLMDIHLGAEDGTSAAFAIKENPKTKDVKVIFLTNMKDPWPAMAGNHEKVTSEMGMEGFLQKGDDLDMIVKRIQEVLGQGVASGGDAMPPSPVAPVPTSSSAPPQS